MLAIYYNISLYLATDDMVMVRHLGRLLVYFYMSLWRTYQYEAVTRLFLS